MGPVCWNFAERTNCVLADVLTSSVRAVEGFEACGLIYAAGKGAIKRAPFCAQ
jgi:hypothetical protein